MACKNGLILSKKLNSLVMGADGWWLVPLDGVQC